MAHGRFLTAVGILAGLVLVGFVALKAELPVQFSRPCRLMPQAEWMLLRTGPDTFEARLLDRRSGNQQEFDLFRFARGDLVHFALSPGMVPGAAVGAGSVVAHLRSHEHQTVLDQLHMELREVEAGLRAAETGAKSEIVAQARSEIQAARALLAQKEAEYRRAVDLRDTGVLSQADYELAESEYQQARAGVAVTENQLQAVEVGEKDEILAIYRAQADLLQQRIRDAEVRAEAETIRCPIAGEVATLQGDSALLRIVSVDTLYALSPVSPSRAERLAAGQAATVRPMARSQGACSGQVVSIDRHAATIDGRTFFWVSVVVPNTERPLCPCIRGTLRFSGKKVSLLAWLSDRLRHAGDRTLGI